MVSRIDFSVCRLTSLMCLTCLVAMTCRSDRLLAVLALLRLGLFHKRVLLIVDRIDHSVCCLMGLTRLTCLTRAATVTYRSDRLLAVLALLRLGLLHKRVLLFVNGIDSGFRLRLFLEAFGVKAAILNAELPINSRQHILQVLLVDLEHK